MKTVCLSSYRFSIPVAVALAFMLVFSSIMLSGSSFADDGSDSNNDVGTPGLVYEYDEGKKVASVKDYKGDDRNVVIPSTVTKDGVVYTVTSIKKSAITKDDDITSLVVPDSVTKIDNYGIVSNTIRELTAPISLKFFEYDMDFDDMIADFVYTVYPNFATYNLTKVTLTKGSGGVHDFEPDNYNMSKWFFDGLPWRASSGSINEIVIEEGVTEIGEAMFYLCHAKSISLPTTLNHIGKMAFRDVGALTSIDIPSGNIGEKAFMGCTSLVEIHIGTGVDTIGKNAFEDCALLESVKIEDGLKSIEPYAFLNCSRLKAITLPNTIEHIGKLAFMNADIRSMVLPENLKVVGSNLFSGCDKLRSLTILGGVIDNHALHNAPRLNTVVLGDKVTAIGAHAFEGCRALWNVEFGSGLKSIGERAFLDCSTLKAVVLKEGVERIDEAAFSTCRAVTTVVIPNSIEIIEEMAFNKCSGIIDLTIPISISAVKLNVKAVFLEVDRLTSIKFTKGTGEGYDYGTSTAYFKDDCYENTPWYQSRNSLTTVILDEGIKSIGENMFRGCEFLYSVSLPSTLTTIDKNAFNGCSDLDDLVLPQGLESIGKSAFKGCIALTTLDLPDSLISIEEGAFENCTEIIDLTLPISLNVVKNKSTFKNCTKISIITFTAGNGKGIDYGDEYKQTPWYICRSAIKVIEIKDGVTYIGKNTFRELNNTDILLPDSITEIGESVFRGCKSLTNVTLPANLLKIGKSAFEDCTALSHVPIPDKTTEIGSFAFKNCMSLTQITIPNSVTSIGKSALEGCSSLKDVVLSESITSIASHLFKNCTALEYISIPASVTSFKEYSFEKCKSLRTIFLNGTDKDSIKMGKGVFKDCSSDLKIVSGKEGCMLELYHDDGHTIVANLDNIGDTLYLKWNVALSMAPNTPVTVPNNDGGTQDDAILTTSVLISILALVLGIAIVRFRP